MADNEIPTPKIAAKNSNKQIKFIVGGLVVLVLIVILAFNSISSTGAYYMTVDELNAQQNELVGKKIRISGSVVHESENWDAAELMLKFSLTDASGEHVVVNFHGSRPSNFGRATEAIVEGQLLADGQFKADNLLLKCPSRYEEAPEVTEFEAMS